MTTFRLTLQWGEINLIVCFFLIGSLGEQQKKVGLKVGSHDSIFGANYSLKFKEVNEVKQHFYETVMS